MAIQASEYLNLAIVVKRQKLIALIAGLPKKAVLGGGLRSIIKMLKALQEVSGLDETEWAAKARIIVGDWLTSNNIRGARKDRMDDINAMERLDYVDELSALWHFALNATHMIMRLHFGDSVLDPGSLAKQKGLLNRTWDAEKPNYADAKALI
jgi:hypothetical protein